MRLLHYLLVALMLGMPYRGVSKSKIQCVPLHMNRIEIQWEEGGDGLLQAMLVNDNHLILASHGSEFIFRVFPLPLTGESFYGIREGRGPGEVQSVDYRSLAPEKNGFWFVDGTGTKEAIVKGQSIIVSSGNHAFRQSITRNGVLRLNEGYIDIDTDDLEREFVFYNKTFSSKKHIGKYPNWDKTRKMLPMFSYVKYMASKPSGDCFVAAYARYPKARLFDGSGNKKKEIDLNFDKAALTPDRVYYVCKPCVNEKMIFLLSQSGHMGTDKPEVHVLDWSGKMLARYVLDCKADLFAIDFKHMILFTCSRDDKSTINYVKLPIAR